MLQIHMRLGGPACMSEELPDSTSRVQGVSYFISRSVVLLLRVKSCTVMPCHGDGR